MYYAAIRPVRPPSYEYPFNGLGQGLGIMDLSMLTNALTGKTPVQTLPIPAGQSMASTAVSQTASDGTCPAGWNMVTDTSGRPKGCMLPAYPARIAGQACSADSPEVFDAQGRSIGCLTQAYMDYTPMVATVDENGNVVDDQGKQIIQQEDSAIVRHPYMTVALAALAVVGASMLVSRGLKALSDHG